MNRASSILAALFALSACDVENPDEINENEVITTVVLTLAPRDGGDDLEFRWADPANDGAPEIDVIVLDDADDYDLTVRFLNELEAPPDEITSEVRAEGEEHQLFFTGTGVEGPAATNPGAPVAHAYADADGNGLPVGLVNVMTTQSPGTGSLVVTLRHLPAEGETAIKTATLAAEVAAGGFTAIGGDTDASVEFVVTVE